MLKRGRAREVAKSVLAAGRIWSAAERAYPHFIIIGAQKAGTTSLLHYLNQSEGVVPPLFKEIHFFDRKYRLGTSWYRSNFPLIHELSRGGKITGEATPLYLPHPDVPERVRRTVPDVRIICLLRDPLERAYSHYRHNCRIGRERRSWQGAVEAELGLLRRVSFDIRALDWDSHDVQRYSYLARGFYTQQLESWWSVFDATRIIVIRAEELFARPREMVAGLCRTLGVRPPEKIDYSARNVGIDEYGKGKPDPGAVADLFASDQRALKRMLGWAHLA